MPERARANARERHLVRDRGPIEGLRAPTKLARPIRARGDIGQAGYLDKVVDSSDEEGPAPNDLSAWVRTHPVPVAAALLVVISLWVAAAGGPPSGSESAAREFIAASLDLDGVRMSELTCDARLREVQSTGGTASAMLLAFGLPTQIRSSISELRFEQVDGTAEEARVRVSGRITMALLGMAQTVPVDQVLVMRYERSQWRYCGQLSRPATP